MIQKIVIEWKMDRAGMSRGAGYGKVEGTLRLESLDLGHRFTGGRWRRPDVIWTTRRVRLGMFQREEFPRGR